MQAHALHVHQLGHRRSIKARKETLSCQLYYSIKEKIKKRGKKRTQTLYREAPAVMFNRHTDELERQCQHAKNKRPSPRLQLRWSGYTRPPIHQTSSSTSSRYLQLGLSLQNPMPTILELGRLQCNHSTHGTSGPAIFLVRRSTIALPVDAHSRIREAASTS